MASSEEEFEYDAPNTHDEMQYDDYDTSNVYDEMQFDGN